MTWHNIVRGTERFPVKALPKVQPFARERFTERRLS
jgi:hypothetical protein